jgi:hypothetical protein
VEQGRTANGKISWSLRNSPLKRRLETRGLAQNGVVLEWEEAV